jgi:hypothetical protein
VTANSTSGTGNDYLYVATGPTRYDQTNSKIVYSGTWKPFTTTGIIDVWVDGLKKATIDLNAATATYQANLYSTGTLSDGAHYVQLVRSDTSAAGRFIVLDAVDIWGTMVVAP